MLSTILQSFDAFVLPPAHLLRPQNWPPGGWSYFYLPVWLWWPCVRSPPAPESAAATSAWTSSQSLGCSSPTVSNGECEVKFNFTHFTLHKKSEDVDAMTTNLLKVIELLLQLLLLRADLRERQLHFFHFFIQARDPPWSGVVGMWKRECEA